MRKIKKYLLIIDGHPVAYKAGIWRTFAEQFPNLCQVIYLDDLGIREYRDEAFGVTRCYGDENLLSGYKYQFSRNLKKKNIDSGFFSRINLDIFYKIFKSPAQTVLIHGYDTFSIWFVFLICKFLRRKVIWRGEVVSAPVNHKSFFKKYFKKKLLNIIFKYADAIMWSCSGNKKYLLKHGAIQEKMFPIPCAVDNDFFQEQRKELSGAKSKIRLGLGIPEDDYVIVFSARFSVRKRPYDLIEAVKNIAEKNITILFVGDGNERKKMEELVKESVIKAKFVGFQKRTDISKYYVIADLAVVLSSYDPSPKALNEIMNFSVPIIVTNVVGTAFDLVKEEKNGYIIKVADINDLTSKISYLNRHRSVSKEMGERSLKIVKGWNYSEDVKGLRNAINYINDRNN